MEVERGKQYRIRDAETLKRVLAGNFSHSPEMLAMAGRIITVDRVSPNYCYGKTRATLEEDSARWNWIPECFEPIDGDSKEPKPEIPVPGTLIHFIDNIRNAPGLGEGGGIGWNGSMEKYGNTTAVVTEVNENTVKKDNPRVRVRGNGWAWSLDSFVVIGPAPCLKLGEWHKDKECSICVNKCELAGEGRFDP